MVFRVFIFIILLFRINVKKGHLAENDFRHYYDNFLKVLFWKLFDYSYVQSSFSAIMRHIDNSNLKYPLQLKILWINIRVNSFIKTWESIVKWKPKKLPRKLWVAEKLSLNFEQHCSIIDHISLIFLCFFFSQTNVVFKFNFVSIGILDNFCHNLFTCLPFSLSFAISLILKFIQCFYTFLKKNH